MRPRNRLIAHSDILPAKAALFKHFQQHFRPLRVVGVGYSYRRTLVCREGGVAVGERSEGGAAAAGLAAGDYFSVFIPRKYGLYTQKCANPCRNAAYSSAFS